MQLLDACRSLTKITLVVSLLVISACGSDADPFGPIVLGGLSMNIDGVPWTAISAQGTSTGGIVAIGAADATGVAFGFAFQGAAPGTYVIGPGNPSNATYSVGLDAWAATGAGGGSGTMTITTLSGERVVGTFSFQVNASGTQTPATVSLTNGVFDIEF